MSTIPEWFWEAVDKSPRVITPRLMTLSCIICLGMRQTAEGFYSSTGTMPRALVGLHCASFLRSISPNRDGYEWHG